MKKIEIKIPDDLTPEQEAVAISKKLMQKAIGNSPKNKDQKLIGSGLTITDLQTQITITRVSKEKPITLCTCSVCGTQYQSNLAAYYWHNYGGNPKKIAVCSEVCKSFVIELLRGRAAATKNKLTPIRFY